MKAGSAGNAAPIHKDQSRNFVLDVVRSAVALPQPDPQDRLRVLYSATSVVAPIDSKVAKPFIQEGTRIETELIAQGQRPAVSMLAEGHVDCGSASTFVQSLPVSALLDADQSLLGAITACPKQVGETAKRKLDAGLEQGTVAARPLMALMEAEGMQSGWSRATFAKVFASLPAKAEDFNNEAPQYAAMFDRAAPAMPLDSVKAAGQKLLSWLAGLPSTAERQMAVNITTDSLHKVLRKDDYDELLGSDVMVQQIANTAGQPAMLQPPGDENVSVLKAMSNKDDRTMELQTMPASLRAREAAASGFASGTTGDTKSADHYFDIAFSSLEEVWDNRATLKTSAPAVVEEVSEAAAHVNAVDALQRAQRLQDPSAQAISMLAVARVVAGGAY